MALVYPEAPEMEYPFKEVKGGQTAHVTEFETGAEQRRKMRITGLRTVSIQYSALNSADKNILWDFYRARKGMFDLFWFYYPKIENHRGEYVGRGNGSQTIFDLPSKQTVSTSLSGYVNGVQAGTTFLSGGGGGGADRVQFTTNPASGAFLTADFEGRLRLYARFGQDDLPYELFEFLLFNIGIELVEVSF